MIKNFNSFLNESNSIDLSNSFIIIRNKYEHNNLMYFLEKNTDCKWIGGSEKPTKIGHLSEYPNIIIDNENILSRSDKFNYGHYKVLNFSDIEKLQGKTKIRKPEEDPFDEENWGYVQEQNKESLTYEMSGPTPCQYWRTKEDFVRDMAKLGHTHTRLTRDTDMLISSEPGTTKYEKALKYGIPIYAYEDYFLNKFGNIEKKEKEKEIVKITSSDTKNWWD